MVGFFDNFVAQRVRANAIESLAPGGDGQQNWQGLEIDEVDICIPQNRYSALIPGAFNLGVMLQDKDIENLPIAGTKTNVCLQIHGAGRDDDGFQSCHGTGRYRRAFG